MLNGHYTFHGSNEIIDLDTRIVIVIREKGNLDGSSVVLLNTLFKQENIKHIIWNGASYSRAGQP